MDFTNVKLEYGKTYYAQIMMNNGRLWFVESSGTKGYTGNTFTLNDIHHHSLVYTAEASNKLAVYCIESKGSNYCKCLNETGKLYLTLSAQDSTEGVPATVNLGTTEEKNKWNEAGIDTPTLAYYKTETEGATTGGTLLQTAPTATGYYYLTATIGDADIVTSYKITSKQSYTVRFDANGGIGSMEDQTLEIDGEATSISTNIFTRSSYTFAGWSTEKDGSVVYRDEDKVKNLSGTNGDIVTLYAVWNADTERHKITVTVNSKYDDTVKLELKQGNKVYASKDGLTLTASNGTYTASNEFTDLVPATYNVVATQTLASQSNKKIVMTKAVIISSKDEYITLEFPYGDTNSVLEVEGDETPDIVVDGLDDEATDYEESGKAVQIKMTVEKKDEDQATGYTAIRGIASSGEEIEYLDFAIEKTTWDVDGSGNRSNEAKSTILETGNIQTIIVPYDTNGKEAADISVYRYHGSSAEKFTRYTSMPTLGSGEDAHYYVDTTNGLVYIYAKKFSTYAIGYAAGSGSSGKGGSSDSGGSSGDGSASNGGSGAGNAGLKVTPPKTGDAGDGILILLGILLVLGSLGTIKNLRKKCQRR